MNYFAKREYAIVLAEYGIAPTISFKDSILPSYARQDLAFLFDVQIAEDFQILSHDTLVSQNTELIEAETRFLSDWVVFAYSGQGDFWLLHKQRNEVGFYDHNLEAYDPDNISSIEISFEEWIILGDLFHQFDLLNETNPAAFNKDYKLKLEYRLNFIEEIESIKKGLFQRLPFTDF